MYFKCSCKECKNIIKRKKDASTISINKHKYYLCDSCFKNIESMLIIKEDIATKKDTKKATKEDTKQSKSEVKQEQNADLQLSNDNKRYKSVEEKIKEFGEDRLKEELNNTSIDMRDLAEMICISETSLRKFLKSKNLSKLPKAKRKKREVRKSQDDKESHT